MNVHERGLGTASKVAQVTLTFWVMKICATTLGETAGDLLSITLKVGYAISSLILLGLFCATLFMQLRSRSFHPALYWSVILTTSTAGTTMSDYLDRSLGLGYLVGSLILVVALAAVLLTWWLSEGNLRVNDIRSRRVEFFYWTAILFSNTLGTAVGDFLADDSGLGFLGGALLIGGLIALVALARFVTTLDRVFLFWTAFVLTRPLGATLGDWLTKPGNKGGLDLGTVGASGVLGAILIVLVIGSTWRQR